MKESLKRTPLFEVHKELGAKIIDFGGWAMPVNYSSVLKEHQAVRNHCGLFDVSHMGEVFVSGAKALDFIQYITINDAAQLKIGEGQYSAMLNEQGGMIDDLIIYRIDNETYLLCVNASNTEKDWAWISSQAKAFSPEGMQLEVSNQSNQWAQIAIQGPESKKVLESILEDATAATVSNLPYMGITEFRKTVNGQQQTLGWIARTGYTGEWGYELYLGNEWAPAIWKELLAFGSSVVPVGLGARDTLRLEACYLLYGNDMDDQVSPLEAGIGWATKIDAKDFIGKSPLLDQKSQGIPRKIFAFTMEENGIPRHGMDVFVQEKLVGMVTSGSVLPTVGGSGGMALLNPENIKIGDTLEIDIRGKRKLARVVKRPLYSARVK